MSGQPLRIGQRLQHAGAALARPEAWGSPLLLAPLLALAGAAFLLVLDGWGSNKVLAAGIGGVALVLMGVLSGNPRLFCLWGLMFALPFDLSKRFGTVIAKMGGETSLRVEFSDVFLAVLAACLLRDLWTGRLAGLRVPRVLGWWGLILLMALGAVAFGTFRLTALHESVRMVKVAVLFLVLVNELQSPQRVLHAAGALSFGALVQALVGLYQYTTRQHLGLDILGETGAGTLDQLAADSVRTVGVFRVGAFMNHPNIFGAFLAAVLPFALAGFAMRLRLSWRLLFIVTAGLGTAALMASQSRSGWLSFAVSTTLLLLLVLVHGRLRMKAVLPAAVAVGVLVLVMASFAGTIVDRIFESKPDAVLGRQEYNNTAYGMIQAAPLLGHGMNSYVYVAPPYTRYGPRRANAIYKDWLPPVHNIYLLWWAELGLVGLLLHLALVATVLRVAWRNLRIPHETLFMVNAACLAGIVALMVDGFFSFTLRINSVLRLFWALSAIVFAIHYLRLRLPGRLGEP